MTDKFSIPERESSPAGSGTGAGEGWLQLPSDRREPTEETAFGRDASVRELDPARPGSGSISATDRDYTEQYRALRERIGKPLPPRSAESHRRDFDDERAKAEGALSEASIASTRAQVQRLLAKARHHLFAAERALLAAIDAEAGRVR